MPAPTPFSRADAATQRALVSQLLESDDELRDLAKVMLKAAMHETIQQLVRGDASTRAAIARAYVTPITKALTETDADDADQTLRAEMQEMFAEMRGDMGLDDPAADEPVVARVIVPKS